MVKQVMQENGHDVSDAENLLSWANLLSNILGVFFSFGIGILSDKVAIYKLLTVVNAIILSTWYLMWLDISKNTIGNNYLIGYIVSNSTLHVSAVLGNTLLGKICNETTRGTMFGFNGLFGSIGICLLQGTGGKLYNNLSKMGPIDIGFGCYVVTFLVTIVFGLTGKIKV